MPSRLRLRKRRRVVFIKKSFILLYLSLYVCKLMEAGGWKVSWGGNATVFVGVYTSIKTEFTPTVKNLEV
jgi:hypothetical protein